MYKWINTLAEGWTKVKYINVGEVTNNSYLGWKKPRRNRQYVTINNTNGHIDWYYSFVNGTWHKQDENGVDYLWTPIEFTLTAEANNENYGEVAASVATPNTYDKTTGKVVKNTTANVAITLTATPEEGYTFVKWKRGEEDLTDTETTITVEEDGSTNVTYTAVFEAVTPQEETTEES